MRSATWPRARVAEERLLWLDPSTDLFGDGTVGDLVRLLRSGDVLVVNDAATLPASLRGEAEVSGEWNAVEIRLASRERGAPHTWRCLAFGAGDWRSPTELRPPPPTLAVGTLLRFGALRAHVVERHSSRVVTVRFEPNDFWRSLYERGRPIQYAYVDAPLELFHVRTSYASRPWASEMPSAGRPLRWSTLLELRRKGVGLARVTHAAGLSSTGNDALDATLPWKESFDIPEETVRAIEVAKRRGGRVIAVGTSVVRALEGAAAFGGGGLASGEGSTELVLSPGFVPKIVGGLFTGIHETTATHFALLQVFVSWPLLERAYAFAQERGYLGHEFGDSCLILDGASLVAA